MPKLDLAQQINETKYRQDENPFDELLQNRGEQTSSKLKVVMLPIAQLEEYKDEAFKRLTGREQPFHCYTTEELISLSESIEKQGVIDPITVRPLPGGNYQIIAGRNRVRACKLIGLATILGIVRTDIDDIKAAMIMLDTNLEQRHNLSYSEKAYAYKMRADLQKQQGKRTDLNAGEDRRDTLSEIGKQNNDKRRKAAYLIRLTFLLPELLQLVDDNQIPFKAGVELSYLSTTSQRQLFEVLVASGKRIKFSQATELRKLEQTNDATAQKIKEIMCASETRTRSSFTIRKELLEEYSDLLSEPKQIEELFREFLRTVRLSRNA